jgi:hypothetical protein
LTKSIKLIEIYKIKILEDLLVLVGGDAGKFKAFKEKFSEQRRRKNEEQGEQKAREENYSGYSASAICPKKPKLSK